jgi:hypothetical protein
MSLFLKAEFFFSSQEMILSLQIIMSYNVALIYTYLRGQVGRVMARMAEVLQPTRSRVRFPLV